MQARTVRAGDRTLAAPATRAAYDVCAHGRGAAHFRNTARPRRGAPRSAAAGAPVAAAADAAGVRATAPRVALGHVTATVAAAICRRGIVAARAATAAAVAAGRAGRRKHAPDPQGELMHYPTHLKLKDRLDCQ